MQNTSTELNWTAFSVHCMLVFLEKHATLISWHLCTDNVTLIYFIIIKTDFNFIIIFLSDSTSRSLFKYE